MDSYSDCQVELRGFQGASAMLELRWQLEYFGSVVTVEPLPEQVGGLRVTFAEPWAAAAAREAFGAYLPAAEDDQESWAAAATQEAFGACLPVAEDPQACNEVLAHLLSQEAPVSPSSDEKEEELEVEVFKPCVGFGGWESVPTQASLGSYMDSDNSMPYAQQGLVSSPTSGELSPASSSQDLQSLADCEEHLNPRNAAVSLSSGPKKLSGLELSQLNWGKLAKGQEWRRDLLVRGLPRHLCERGALEAFLAAKGLREFVEKVRVMPGKGLRPGSAVLMATSTGAVAKLAKFFHGAQFSGCRSPVAVGFAPGKCSRRGAGLEPMRVSSGGSSALPVSVPLPPGLECWTCPF